MIDVAVSISLFNILPVRRSVLMNTELPRSLLLNVDLAQEGPRRRKRPSGLLLFLLDPTWALHRMKLEAKKLIPWPGSSSAETWHSALLLFLLLKSAGLLVKLTDCSVQIWIQIYLSKQSN